MRKRSLKSSNPSIATSFVLLTGDLLPVRKTRSICMNTQMPWGIVGASSIERIPIEKAIKEVVNQFKSVPLGRNQRL